MKADRWIVRLFLAVVAFYACWLGMLALHELGHVLHARVSGARVLEVRVPLCGFSQTFVNPNPAPYFVAYGGAFTGCVVPLVACGLAWTVRRKVPEPLKFFTGFCLIANGLYTALGWLGHHNDSADLLELGVSWSSLLLLGGGMTTLGLIIWHRLTWLTLRKRARTSAGGGGSPPVQRVDPPLEVRDAVEDEDEQPGQSVDHAKECVFNVILRRIRRRIWVTSC